MTNEERNAADAAEIARRKAAAEATIAASAKRIAAIEAETAATTKMQTTRETISALYNIADEYQTIAIKAARRMDRAQRHGDAKSAAAAHAEEKTAAAKYAALWNAISIIQTAENTGKTFTTDTAKLYAAIYGVLPTDAPQPEGEQE